MQLMVLTGNTYGKYFLHSLLKSTNKSRAALGVDFCQLRRIKQISVQQQFLLVVLSKTQISLASADKKNYISVRQTE